MNNSKISKFYPVPNTKGNIKFNEIFQILICFYKYKLYHKIFEFPYLLNLSLRTKNILSFSLIL